VRTRRFLFIVHDLLSENYGDPTSDYLIQYEDGRMTYEAKQIYEALLEHGPQHVIELRRLAGLTGGERSLAFQRALTDLQADLKILPVGVAEAGAWQYAFIYDLVTRWYPEVPEKARGIKGSEARRKLLAVYLDNVIAATVDQAARLFGWPANDVDRAAAKLVEEGSIVIDTNIEGMREKQLLSARANSDATVSFP
jgi:hypothetical protein